MQSIKKKLRIWKHPNNLMESIWGLVTIGVAVNTTSWSHLSLDITDIGSFPGSDFLHFVCKERSQYIDWYGINNHSTSTHYDSLAYHFHLEMDFHANMFGSCNPYLYIYRSWHINNSWFKQAQFDLRWLYYWNPFIILWCYYHIYMACYYPRIKEAMKSKF